MKLSRSLWLHGKIHVTIAIQIIFFHHAGGQRRYGRFLFEDRMFMGIRPGLISIHENLFRLPATPARPWKGHTDRFQRQLSHGISIIIKILECRYSSQFILKICIVFFYQLNITEISIIDRCKYSLFAYFIKMHCRCAWNNSSTFHYISTNIVFIVSSIPG